MRSHTILVCFHSAESRSWSNWEPMRARKVNFQRGLLSSSHAMDIARGAQKPWGGVVARMAPA